MISSRNRFSWKELMGAICRLQIEKFSHFRWQKWGKTLQKGQKWGKKKSGLSWLIVVADNV
ncbi:hypothetical protein EYX94_18165 [Escherichia coli]|nr:hypothetical protein [Escherichia coli]MDN2388391.1 hypothetical protein [Escherichia coli]TIJ86540.1 hypothetical protein EYX95_18220 [Escherichia coli]TIJ99561.1 hypothetical protein EYX94_18165 [Escherichia coli]